jgi:hypothetical protein
MLRRFGSERAKRPEDKAPDLSPRYIKLKGCHFDHRVNGEYHRVEGREEAKCPVYRHEDGVFWMYKQGKRWRVSQDLGSESCILAVKDSTNAAWWPTDLDYHLHTPPTFWQ